MTTYTAEHLYELLPAIYRLRDAEQGYPLRSLLGVVAREIGIVEEDIARLYANWFIETGDEWVVPYIGDLLGVRGLYTLEGAGVTRRAFVANTLSYRRRKGTVTVLEQLAQDTTQWRARVVEFFELLGTTQSLNHLRPHNVRTPDLRQTHALELLDTPFDGIGHTVDVRRIAASRGKHNIPNIGIFLWRLQAYFVTRTTPRAVASPADGRYTFSPLGNDAPLFNRPQTETTITHLADEVNVPGRLRRRALYDDLEELRHALVDGAAKPQSSYLGMMPVLQIFVPDQAGKLAAIPPEEILVCDLGAWGRPLTSVEYTSRTQYDPSVNPPVPLKTTRPIQVAVDPVRGRLAFPTGVAPNELDVSYAYGFSGDLGGGPYDRRFLSGPDDPMPSPYENTVVAPDQLGDVYHVSATKFNTITLAIARWTQDGNHDAVIQIDDSRTYEEDLTIPVAESDLVIQAANRQRPTVIGDLNITGNINITGNQLGRLALNGLLIAGSITVDGDSVRQLDVLHCTLVPGVTLAADGTPLHPATPSIIAGSTNKSLTLNAVRSITGPLLLGANMVGLHAQDCIIESPRRGHPADLVPVLVSGTLRPFPTGLPSAPRVRVMIGGDGPYIATLAAKPTTLAQARDLLQDALCSAHAGPAFTGIRVIAAGNRLIVLPGIPCEVSVEVVGGDDTADRLRLTQGTGEQRMAVVSGVLSSFPTLSAATPALRVTLGAETHTITLNPSPGSLAQARVSLGNAIHAASNTPAFRHAIVRSTSGAGQLVVIPGIPDVVVGFDTTPTDATTLAELRLAHQFYLPAIGGDRSGAQPGPRTTLERVTVLGPVHVKELALGSEVIFTDRVRTVRRQAGCVRFSYVPPGSQTPRRFRCQPELAIASALDQAQEETVAPLDRAAAEAIRAQILSRLTPTFASTRYGDPAYGQLSLTCPAEIGTGAEDGSEMGAFSFLKQPQRTANLQSNLEEYLRFGLEAGIFFVT